MSLKIRLEELALRLSTEFKSLRTLINGNVADLTSLSTTNKTNLVAALNEVKGLVDSLSAGAAGIADGSTGTGTTWSSQKISDQIAASINALVDGAPTALDTLKELADALAEAGDVSAITTALSHRVRTDTATQGLTPQEQANARTNIGAASAAAIGDTETNLVAIFEAGL